MNYGKKKVVVGMSGGVDSSVAAALLVEQGYDVTGVFIEAYNEPGCRTDEDKRDALRVATKLDIRFKIFDLRKEYKEQVVKYFFDEYEAGRTPNPDVVCNREVKFGLFYEWALKNGFDYVATGHYGRITEKSNKATKQQHFLQRPRDLSKDQTYFLWQVTPEKLEHIIFPLGGMLKSEVRELAKKYGFANADKPDSMGVCMMGELNVAQFLKNKLGEKEGEVVLKFSSNPVLQYSSVGTHKGLWFYTIGQRVGGEMKLNSQILKLGYAANNMPPLYVIGKDQANNILIIGEREECYSSQFSIHNLQFSIDEDLMEMLINKNRLFVRIRNLGELAIVTRCQRDTVTLQVQVTTLEPLFAPAPGQSAVFYGQIGEIGREVVVGGGIIAN